jgi:esterase
VSLPRSEASVSPPEIEISHAEYLGYQRALLDSAGVDAEPALPDSQQALVRGARLHYLDWGGDGPPVIFLHGRAQTAHMWDLLCLALRKDCRCIAVDQRGHGLSEWSPEMDYRSSTVARDLVSLADHLDLPRFTLVGFSMGGANAVAFAVTNPQRVERLVVFEAVLKGTLTPGVERIREFLTGEDEFPSFEALLEKARSFSGRREPDLLRFSLRWNVLRLPNGSWTWRDDRRHRKREDIWRVMLADRRRFAAELHRITCPTLFVRGGASDLVSTEDATEFADAVAGPVTYVEIPGMGHAVFGPDPKLTIAVVREFACG